MKSTTELSQKSELRTRLLPRQVQFVRLLEMSGPEIEEAVRNELDDNPALEAVDAQPLSGSEFQTDGNSETFNESSEQLQAADYAGEDEMPSYLANIPLRGQTESASFLTDQHRDSLSLLESLNEQLDMIDADSRDVAIARYLIGYLDDNGRLSRSLRDIADDISIATGREVTRNDLKPGLDIIRYELDPPGLGATDLRECLLIQLRRLEPKTLAIRAAQEIIEHNFDLFTKKHLDKLRAALGVDKETIDNAIDVIRSLDPKPGSNINDAGADKALHIVPDFTVVPIEDSSENTRFSVTLNQRLPELDIEQSFVITPEDRNGRMFVRRKREEAKSFIDLINRRSNTLMAVMQAIVRLQNRFFETEDTADLRPMILKDISELTGLDSSVISRATSGKYVSTRGGIYPLKMFFNDTPTHDEDISSSKIVAALRQLIDSENKQKPLSDRALTEALNKMGYALARRTVTKYREKNEIPVARLRKEL